jgi:methylamine dehydrogenase heavy chain
MRHYRNQTTARPSVIQAAILCLALLLVSGGAGRAEPIGRVLDLPEKAGPHWIWISDLLFARTALWDADSGSFLGMISAGLGAIAPNFSSDGREIYLAETHYSRRTRGERTDVVTVYDAMSLRPVTEVTLPPKRAEHTSGVATSALSDDDRFLAVFNLTPATSLSIVDVKARRFTAEIATPGCSLVYAAGDRRFAMLCGDGSMLTVEVDDAGREAAKQRTKPFFDPQTDPVTEKAARDGNRWLFVSFEGRVHPVDLSGGAPRFEEVWSLLTEDDRDDSWRIGGHQHLAVHEGNGRLYALMHQGGPDTHKQPGTEIWVYDLETRKRIQRISARNPTAVFLRQSMEVGDEGFWAWLVGWLIESLVPNPGVDRILVSRDEKPILLTSSAFPPTASVYDALTGEFLRDFEEVGISTGMLQAP